MISHSEASENPDTAVRVRVDASSGTIILNRPTKRNALSRAMLTDLQQALSDLHQEKKVRAVIITGAADVFSAGTDVYEIQQSMGEDDPQAIWFADTMAQKDLIESMLRFPKPIIAAVNGPALGMAAAIVLACDYAIGTESASLGFPETALGLVSGVASPLLTFRLGASTAANLLLCGELATAKECVELGIYRCLVADNLVWAKADTMARSLSGRSAQAISMTKRLLNETIGEHLFTQLSSGAAATASARTTEAAQEGINAFLEKRAPEWP